MTPAELPQPVSIVQNGNETRIEASVPADLAFLAGHFPGAPVVAGVVQVAWVQHYARQHLSVTGEFSGMEQLKFQRLLRPRDVFTLQLQLADNGAQVTFRLHNAAHVFSSGKLLFGA